MVTSKPRMNCLIHIFLRKVNDGQWGWRALRLLAKKSPHFFTYGNNPIAKLPDYLDSMLKKMSNYTPSATPGLNSNGTKETKEESSPASPVELCTKEHINRIASNLGDKWPKLLPKLGIDSGEQEKFAKEGKDDKGTCSTNRINMQLQ